MLINKKADKKRYIILGLLAVLLLCVMYFLVAAANKYPPFSADSNSPQIGEQKVSLEKSQAEKQAIEALKDNPDAKTENAQADVPTKPVVSETGKAKVNVLVTNAGISNGTVSASGFATNIVEEGGSCTYTFSNGAEKHDKTAKTLMNSTSTTCETVRFPASELQASGEWKVSIAYSSSSAYGLSDESGFVR